MDPEPHSQTGSVSGWEEAEENPLDIGPGYGRREPGGEEREEQWVRGLPEKSSCRAVDRHHQESEQLLQQPRKSSALVSGNWPCFCGF